MVGAGDAGARVFSGLKHICVKPEALLEVRTEGCEPIYRWYMTDEVILAMRGFCLAVQNREVEKVEKFISNLMASEGEDTKPSFMADKLCSGEVEKYKEVLLIAILSGSRPLAEFVLQLFVECPSAEQTGCINSSLFPPHLTPLMVACLSNNFALVECLLLRGHFVELPHRHDCNCYECKHHNAAGRMDVKRLDLFRVICSEAYLWLATDDPLLAAMHLIEDLKLSLGFNNEHKEVYAELLNRVNTYTVAVSQHCWSFEEMDLILSQKHGSRIIYCNEVYPRALLAIEKQMKPFVSHVNVQSVMSLQWMGKWTDFGFNKRRDSTRVFRHAFLFPLIGLLHIFSGRKLFTSFRNPAARFISQTSAYVIMLACICISRAYDEPDMEDTGWLTPNTFLFGYIYGYFVGFILDQAAAMWIMGSEFYFDMWWKWMDFAMCHVMLTVFILHILMLGEANVYNPQESMMEPGHVRVYYDIVFSLACLLATGRGLYNLQLFRNLGSTIISTGRCMGEVVEYFFIMGLVMISFSIALNLIAQPYHVDAFSRIIMAFRNLFWAFYGYLAPGDYKITDYDFSHDNFNKSLAQAGIEWLTVLYYMVMVISLLNLMISLLVERAHVIMENEEPEWKYTRSYIYSEYWHAYSTLPPPFNIIVLIFEFIAGLIRKRRTDPDEKEAEKIFEKNSSRQYQKLLVVIFRRYVASQRFHFINSSIMDKSPHVQFPGCKINFLNNVLHDPHKPPSAQETAPWDNKKRGTVFYSE